MKRIAIAVCALISATPAFAQNPKTRAAAAIEVMGIYDDNGGLTPTPESLFVLAVSPSAEVEAPLRYVDLSASYRLTYYNYTTEGIVTRAPDFAHDASLRAALTVWEGVDLAVSDSLKSIGALYGLPHDAPENLVLRNVAAADLGIRFDLGEANALRVSYDADRVDYIDEDTLPAYLLHGPSLTFERELSRDFMLGIGYGFRLQDFDKEGPNKVGASVHGDYTSQNAMLTAQYAGSRWNALHFRAGYQYVTASESTLDPINAFAAEIGVDINPSEYLGFALSGLSQFTVDIDGAPAQRTEARVVASVVPMGELTILVEGAYGQLVITPEAAGSETDRDYMRASLSLDYEIMEYVRARAGYIYHMSSSTGVGGVDVNRVFVSIVGQYR